MSDLVKNYIEAKERFEFANANASEAIYRVLEAYSKEKDKVSTNSSWGERSKYDLDKWHFKGYNVHLRLYHSYNGGGGDERFFEFPQSWLEMSDLELHSAIMGRLEEERIDIEQRAEKAKLAKADQIRKEELAKLAELKLKYE